MYAYIFIAKSVISVLFLSPLSFKNINSFLIECLIFYSLDNGHFTLCSNGSMKCVLAQIILRYRFKIQFLALDIYFLQSSYKWDPICKCRLWRWGMRHGEEDIIVQTRTNSDNIRYSKLLSLSFSFLFWLEMYISEEDEPIFLGLLPNFSSAGISLSNMHLSRTKMEQDALLSCYFSLFQIQKNT